MRGGLRSRTEQQEDHRHHLLAADASAFLLDADQLRDQAFAAGLARSLQAPLQVALHRPDAGDHAQEADHAGEAGQAVRPGDEAGPVGAWQAEQLADDRQRQFARIALDQVGRAAVGKQLGRKLIGNGEDARLHVENGAAAKGFVDDAAQPRVVRLVHGQHADRERADPSRASTSAGRRRVPSLRIVNVSLSFRTRPASSLVVVIQVLPTIGKRTSTTGPAALQPRERRGGIAQIVLAREIETPHDV